MKTIRLALCQINPTVGDFEGNVEKITHFIKEASQHSPDIIVFPELSITGYPPEDLLLKPQFIDDNLRAIKRIQENVDESVVIVGFVDKTDDIYNAAAIIYNRTIVDIYHKMYLPNYGVFDEYRYFQAGNRCPVYQLGDTIFGINICEDIWYPDGPSTFQALAGAEFIININASPYYFGKLDFRQRMLSIRASDNDIVIAYLNLVGGQDELVFDGGSMVIDQNGETRLMAPQFKEDMVIVDLDLDAVFMKRLHAPRRRQQVIYLKKGAVEKITITERKIHRVNFDKKFFCGTSSVTCRCAEEEIYNALVLGTSDYVSKNGFSKVCIGLSGGIDSSLVATIAADSIGRENVTGLFMPSPYTSKESKDDAYELAGNLGINIIEIPITDIYQAYLNTLKASFKELPFDVTEENIQARIRGNILMAFSNKFKWLVLTTGNKSEMSVGYATLYGDMAGGFAVIKDVPKTMVYKLCKWKNQSAGKVIIPERVLRKEPSAELKPDQRDTDTLPPYEVLDPILKAYVEEDMSFDEIVNLGCEIDCVKKVIGMIDASEYKRRQSPPGIKITKRSLGKDRRFPITNKYRSW